MNGVTTLNWSKKTGNLSNLGNSEDTINSANFLHPHYLATRFPWTDMNGSTESEQTALATLRNTQRKQKNRLKRSSEKVLLSSLSPEHSSLIVDWNGFGYTATDLSGRQLLQSLFRSPLHSLRNARRKL